MQLSTRAAYGALNKFAASLLMARAYSQEGIAKSMIYTRGGDKGLSKSVDCCLRTAQRTTVYVLAVGTSSLYNGERRNKSDSVFDALGAVDELNASLGCF